MSKPVVVNFIGDATKLNRTIGQTQKNLGGMKKAIGLVAGLGLGTALFSGLKSTINAAKESQAVNRETATRIKEMGNAANISAVDVAKLATSISNKTGKDDEAIQSGANMLLTFANIRNEVGAGNDVFNQATQVATDMASKFGGDASKSAIQLGKALNDPIKGVSALGRIGVTFTESQKKQIATMVKSGDIMGAQKIILAEVGKQTKGAAEASTTGWDKFLVKVGNIQEDLGTKLLPVIDDLSTKLMKGIDFVGKHSTAFKILGGVILGVTGFIIAMNVATKVTLAVQKAAKIATAIWTGAQWLLNAALTANPIGLVVVAIALLVGGLVLAYKRSETFRKIVDGAFHAVATAGKFMWEKVLKPTFRFLITTWLTVAGAIVNGAATAFGWVPGIGPKLKEAAKKFNEFKDKVNTSLGNVDDEGVNVKFKSTFTPPKGFSMHDIVGARKGMRLPGFGGGDRIPILAEAGETVVSKEHTRRYAQVLAAMGVPGFAGGGLLLNSSLFSPSGVTRALSGIGSGVGSRAAGGLESNFRLLLSQGMPAIKNFIRTLDRLNYGWGGTGPNVYDCSGIVSAVLGKMLGIGSAGKGLRLFTTGSIRAGQYGLRSGLGGLLQIGVTPGTGHMAGRYGGLGFEAESTRTGIKVGSAASRPESFARHFYHMQKGGLVRWIQGLDVGGDFDKLRLQSFDGGGSLQPGLTLAWNGTRRPESVGGGDVHVHFHGDVYGDKYSITKIVRAGLKEQLKREGKRELASQL